MQKTRQDKTRQLRKNKILGRKQNREKQIKNIDIGRDGMTSVVIEGRISYAQYINLAMKTVHVVTNVTKRS